MTYPNSIENLIPSLGQLLESLGISCFVERDALAVALTGTDAPSFEFGLFAFSLDGEEVLLGVRSAARRFFDDFSPTQDPSEALRNIAHVQHPDLCTSPAWHYPS